MHEPSVDSGPKSALKSTPCSCMSHPLIPGPVRGWIRRRSHGSGSTTYAQPMPYRPAAVAFDVNETLINLHPMIERFEKVGLPGYAVKEWFPRTLLYGVGLRVAGDYI